MGSSAVAIEPPPQPPVMLGGYAALAESTLNWRRQATEVARADPRSSSAGRTALMFD